jgi:hypothetical protein
VLVPEGYLRRFDDVRKISGNCRIVHFAELARIAKKPTFIAHRKAGTRRHDEPNVCASGTKCELPWLGFRGAAIEVCPIALEWRPVAGKADRPHGKARTLNIAEAACREVVISYHWPNTNRPNF